MTSLRSVCIVGCAFLIACGLGQSGNTNDARLREAIAACAGESATNIDACRDSVRLGLAESGIRIPETEAFDSRIAKAFAVEGRPEDALAMYRAAVRRHPLNADLHFELGRLLVDQFGATEEALGPFMEAVRRRPRFPEAMLALARVQYELQYFDQAARQYRATLELLPDSPEALRGLREALAASTAAASKR